MENSENILIIILSVTLTVLLVVLIIAITKLIQILNHLNSIIEKAHKLADSAESVGDFFKNNAAPLALVKLIANISHTVFNRKKNARGKGNE
jgi:hypothetical protein